MVAKQTFTISLPVDTIDVLTERAERAGMTPGKLIEAVLVHAGSGKDCPTCQGPMRETTGLVCRCCGADYWLD